MDLRKIKKTYELGADLQNGGVYIISEKYPSKLAIHSNAHALARYATLVQENRMVPIIEPEVLMEESFS